MCGELWELLQDRLRALAGNLMREQGPQHTLQATALMNEAYLRLAKGRQADGSPYRFEGEAQFYALASRVMRSVLVDHARGKGRAKRQEPGERVPLDELLASYEEQDLDLLDLDQALEELAELDPQLVQLVEMRTFGGRSMAEAAKMLGLPLRTAEREWSVARGWLRKRLG